MPRKESTTGQISAQAQQELVSDGIENYELPKTLVTRIAKSGIPENSKLQKEAVLSLVKGSTVFINYLAATAHDVALSKQHKSISASDVLKALELIEFGDLNEMLQNELQIYRNNMKNDKGKKERAEKSAASAKGKAKEGPVDANAASVSSVPNPKAKGKEKASASASTSGTMLPPPFTSTPRPISVSAPPDPDQRTVDAAAFWRAAEAEDEEMDVEDEPGLVEEEDEGDVDEDVDVDDEAGEEVQDMMAVEEDEVRKDAQALEERGLGSELAD
jgi:DNA polymerase epsilon subunit 3